MCININLSIQKDKKKLKEHTKYRIGIPREKAIQIQTWVIICEYLNSNIKLVPKFISS